MKIDSATYGIISDMAIEGYSLEEILEENGLEIKMKEDPDVKESFKSGLIYTFIEKKINGIYDEEIISETEITQRQCDEWSIIYDETISYRRLEVRTATLQATKQFSDPLISGMKNITALDQSLNNSESHKVLREDVKVITKSLQEGNTADLLNILVTQTLQLQALNNKITNTVMNSDRYDIMSRFENLQIKTMSETRKTVMAINEVCNPKRAVFVKEANQHNHIHTSNSEKKYGNENELQKCLENTSVISDINILNIEDASYAEKK